MALLTVPQGIAKGSPFTVTLDKSMLFALNAVASNAHFSNQSKVATCLVKYESPVQGSLLGQTRIIRFDLSQANPSHVLNISSAGADLFQISQILLVDHEGAVLSLPPVEFPSINLEFSSGGGGGGGGGITFNSIMYLGNDNPAQASADYQLAWSTSEVGQVDIEYDMGMPGMWMDMLTNVAQASDGFVQLNLSYGYPYSIRLKVNGVVSSQSFSVPAPSGGEGGGGGEPQPSSITLVGPPIEGETTVTFNWNHGGNVNEYVVLTHADYQAGLWVKVAVLGPITNGTATINKADILALGLNQPKAWPYKLETSTDAAGNNRTGLEAGTFNLALNLYDSSQPSTLTHTSSNSDGIYVNVNWSFVNVPLDSRVALMIKSSPGSNNYVDLVSDAGLSTGGSYYAYSLPQGYVRGANFKLDLRSSTGAALGVSSAVFQIPTRSTISVTSHQVVDGNLVVEWTGSALDSGEYVVLAHARYDLGVWEKVAVLGPISAQIGSVPEADLLALQYYPEWPLKLIVTSDSTGSIGQGFGQGLNEAGF